ncbi:hypothetical protein [Stutzerimonas balearica]|uniref:hypothetical protein n=1 Tax=Stutzerimonas balearica TaxID=74829 RepID=UPI0028AF68D1|nr:hypothetical protein [Stutzerimonas balearica]
MNDFRLFGAHGNLVGGKLVAMEFEPGNNGMGKDAAQNNTFDAAIVLSQQNAHVHCRRKIRRKISIGAAGDPVLTGLQELIAFRFPHKHIKLKKEAQMSDDAKQVLPKDKKFTMEMPVKLHTELKRLAAITGRPAKDLVIEALTEYTIPRYR